ncbi:hypothetical protein U1Q18_013515 [Sarracenia purpurea var. burkii]
MSILRVRNECVRTMVREAGEDEVSEASSGSGNSKEEDGDEGGSKDEEGASSCVCDEFAGIAMTGPSSYIDEEVKISDSGTTGPVLVQNTGKLLSVNGIRSYETAQDHY